jgi:hypothetical protein
VAEIRVESPLEEGHPQRQALETVVRCTLRDFAGTWHVLIRQAQREPWWIVVLDRERSSFKRTLLVDPSETPEAVATALVRDVRSRRAVEGRGVTGPSRQVLRRFEPV